MATNGRLKRRPKRKFDARPDTLDFRDQMYVATLVEVPKRIELSNFKKAHVPILDQGEEGACTGFGLATVANYLSRRRATTKEKVTDSVSPRMLYEMARRYDEWPGVAYEGSSARGAMKGWHKHGVCSEKAWPYDPKKPGHLDARLAKEATGCPLGAYYRVNHKDLVAMHAALTEVGILYATASVTEGWDDVDDHGVIPHSRIRAGGHAFVLVAFDERGFWLQNSWGRDWGKGGIALITYDDWLENGDDVWVARLGAPVELTAPGAVARSVGGAMRSNSFTSDELRPHIITLGNDGEFCPSGTYATTPERLNDIFNDEFPRITQRWTKKRLLIYAHGGLVNEEAAVQRVADYRSALLDAQIYPLALVWKTDYWTTLSNVLRDALRRRRPEGFLDGAKDFMMDRLDDALEPIARQFTGKLQWDEMKENALLATTGQQGGARLLVEQLAQLSGVEFHVIGHSAAGILHAPLVQLLGTKGTIAAGPLKGETGKGKTITSCTLWAPACTIDLFNETYRPLIESGGIKRFALFTLTDRTEQDDDCAGIYHKSLLYLVSNAFEKLPRVPLFRDGVPLLGMRKFVDAHLRSFFKKPHRHLILAPNAEPVGSATASRSHRHGDFDDDEATVRAALAFMLGRSNAPDGMAFEHTRSGTRDVRNRLMQTSPQAFVVPRAN